MLLEVGIVLFHNMAGAQNASEDGIACLHEFLVMMLVQIGNHLALLPVGSRF